MIIKYFAFAYICAKVFIHTNSAPVFDLKIEYNQTNDKQTAADKLDVAFVNKVNLNETAVVNNRISDGKLILSSNLKQESRCKHTLYNNESGAEDLVANTENSRTSTINKHSEETDAATFKQLENEDVKQNLNRFSMAKRNSFYITPAFEYPKFNTIKTNDDSFEIYNNIRLDDDDLNVVGVKQENLRSRNSSSRAQDYNMFGNIVFTQGNNKDLGVLDAANQVANRNMRYNSDISNRKSQQNEDRDILTVLNHPEVAEILKKQKYLIEKLENYLRTEKVPKLRTDFDDLLKSIENKRNNTHIDVPQERITAETTTTPKLSTVMTMIDQTEVRKALMNDPFVRRILKMAKQKKAEYMKNAKKQYSNMLYI